MWVNQDQKSTELEPASTQLDIWHNKRSNTDLVIILRVMIAFDILSVSKLLICCNLISEVCLLECGAAWSSRRIRAQIHGWEGTASKARLHIFPRQARLRLLRIIRDENIAIIETPSRRPRTLRELLYILLKYRKHVKTTDHLEIARQMKHVQLCLLLHPLMWAATVKGYSK